MIAVPTSLYVNQRLGDTRAIFQRPEAFPFGLSLPVLSLSKGRRLNGQDLRPVETPVSRCTGQALRISDGHEELGLNGEDFPSPQPSPLRKGVLLPADLGCGKVSGRMVSHACRPNSNSQCKQKF